MRTVLHIDFNSYFASVEQQANPRLRGKPIGVTGGDRLTRTVLGTASVEAKKLGVKTGMSLWEAKKICPSLILVKGDSDKYLSVTKQFLNILKSYSPILEVFSIDEAFLEIPSAVIPAKAGIYSNNYFMDPRRSLPRTQIRGGDDTMIQLAQEIKQRIKSEIGEWITCSIGISYNKLMAKLAGSLKKPDGLVVIPNQEAAIKVLDSIQLDEICGIGPRIKKRLFNMGIQNFAKLRQVPKELFLASFKSYGEVLYNMARGIDHSPIISFYQKGEVKSIGHRYTIDHNTDNLVEIRQILFKLCETVAKRLRDKKLLGKTIHLWFRYAQDRFEFNPGFEGDGRQKSLVVYTCDGIDIFQTAWLIFNDLWDSRKIRMIGTAISNLKPTTPKNLSVLEEDKKKEILLQTIDQINNKFGDFTLQRGSLLYSTSMHRKPNPFLADRRFKI